MSLTGLCSPQEPPALNSSVSGPQSRGLRGSGADSWFLAGLPRQRSPASEDLDVCSSRPGGPDPVLQNMALQRAVLLAGLLVEVASKSSDSAAATGTGTRTGASAVSSAGMEPTTVPSAEAGALKWQPPCSWGHSSSARASSSPWPGSSTSSVPVGSPGSSTGETKSLPCSLEKLLR
ncbi:uncharacterized protein C1orf159 homolog isoform X16 [Equus asinus]|uniref:uncharacterized protein C1orf159 homolog isoform X16 n=1 Tax=Equus asinus TaxID=9793 RepID=UPI001D035EAD|nr:uncharacterized protein C1orf159 homolog isoform X18 [Equus asinus]